MADRAALESTTPAGNVALAFARQLADLRAARGETQKQLAARLGMTESMISRLESGAHIPSVATLCRIAAGFGRRLEIVFHEHPHEHPGGVRHTHPHRHGIESGDHDHAHAPASGEPEPRPWT